MVRAYLVAAVIAAAALAFATPATATPCDDGLSSLDYALMVAMGETPAPLETPSCKYGDDCKCSVYYMCAPHLPSGGRFSECMYEMLPIICPGASW